MSQLTLTLDDDLLRAAQAYAHQHGQELDAWVAQLVANAVPPLANAPIESPPTVLTRPLSPRVQRLFGAVSVPDDFDYKKALEEAVQERFKQ